MISRKLLLFTLIFSSMLIGCNNSPKDKLIVLSKYPNKNIHTAINSISDSVFVYLIYFEDGSIKDSLPYKNGRLEGIAREYYIDNTTGPTKYYTSYVNSVPNGPARGFYNTGEIRWAGYAYGLNYIGEMIYYFKSGKISAYSYYNDYGEEKFFRKYNEAGDSLQEVGDFIISLKNFEDTYNPLDSIKFSCIVASPRDLKIQAYFGDLNKKQGIYNPHLAEINENIFEVNLIAPEKSGEYIGSLQIRIVNQKGKMRKLNNYFRIWVK
jgi:hypothetical protein